MNKTTKKAIERLERISDMLYRIDENDSVKMTIEQISSLEGIKNDVDDLIKSMREQPRED